MSFYLLGFLCHDRFCLCISVPPHYHHFHKLLVCFTSVISIFCVFLHVYIVIMATSGSTSVPFFVIFNISNLVSIKLDRHNHLLWRSQFEPLFLSHDLMGFIDGSNPCPDKFILDNDQNVTSTISPTYIEWIRQDQNHLS